MLTGGMLLLLCLTLLSTAIWYCLHRRKLAVKPVRGQTDA